MTGLRHGDGSGWDRDLDPAGREVQRVGSDGTVSGRFTYDIAGRLVAATVPSSGFTVEFLWDDNDRLAGVADIYGLRSVERDADGLASATSTTPEPDGRPRATSSAIEPAG